MVGGPRRSVPVMPLPVIPDVFRVSMPWTGGVVSPVNVLHVATTAPSNGSDVAQAFDDALAGLSQDPWHCLADVYLCPVIDVLELDGTSATVAHTMGNIPQGGVTGEELPNCAGIVSLHTTERGSRGRGRQYVGPTTEPTVSFGSLDPAVAAFMFTGWTELIANLLGGALPLILGIASYVHANFHPVTSLRIDSIVGTQRRRLDQLR